MKRGVRGVFFAAASLTTTRRRAPRSYPTAEAVERLRTMRIPAGQQRDAVATIGQDAAKTERLLTTRLPRPDAEVIPAARHVVRPAENDKTLRLAGLRQEPLPGFEPGFPP